MKTIKGLLLLLGVTFCLTGCMTTETTISDVTHKEHVFVRDYGWKLFNCIPFCRSDITQDKVLAELTATAAKRGKTAHNISFHNYDNIMLNIPMLAITIPIPYVLCYKECQVSGELQ